MLVVGPYVRPVVKRPLGQRSLLLRRQSSLTKLHIVKSLCKDPFLNLAFEEALLHQFESNTRTLFLWQNKPTIVLGRNQNVWKEINLPQARSNGVIVTRRESGGGCVYHDSGNVNITFFTEVHQPFDNLAIIQRSLASIGIDAQTSSRHELLLGDRKISGSAFRLLGKFKQCYHHCTLLIKSDLNFLDSVLLSNVEKSISSKATNSVRSVVTNITHTHPLVDKDRIFEALSTHFVLTYKDGEDITVTYSEVTEEEMKENRGVLDVIHRFQSWDWIYGQSPKFSTSFTNKFGWGEVTVVIHCTKGRVEVCEIETNPVAEVLEMCVQQILVGKNYSQEIIKDISEQAPTAVDDTQWSEFWNWLLQFV